MNRPLPTQPSLYIASSLLNARRVRDLRDRFDALGVQLTFDWTTAVGPDGELLHAPTPDITKIAGREANGVVQARCLLLVMPARNGSHFEAGIAFGRQIPIVLLNDVGISLDISFHHRHELLKCRTEGQAVYTVLEILRGRRHIGDHLMGQDA